MGWRTCGFLRDSKYFPMVVSWSSIREITVPRCSIPPTVAGGSRSVLVRATIARCCFEATSNRRGSGSGSRGRVGMDAIVAVGGATMKILLACFVPLLVLAGCDRPPGGDAPATSPSGAMRAPASRWSRRRRPSRSSSTGGTSIPGTVAGGSHGVRWAGRCRCPSRARSTCGSRMRRAVRSKTGWKSSSMPRCRITGTA